MSEPTRDEIAMALLRATARFEAGQEDLPTNEYDMKMLLAGILADAVLALLASKRAAEPDVRTFGPIGPVEREWVGPPRSGTFLKVLPDPPVPHGVTHIPMPQNVPNEPPEWMTTTGKSGWRDNSIGALMDSCADVLRDLTTPTPDQPKEGDDNE